MTVVRRLRRCAALAVVLAVAAIVVPDAAVHPHRVSLVKVDGAQAVDHDGDVLWILGLGSDARRGQAPLQQRADAIQMIVIDLSTGRGGAIGIPRDSWVSIPGHGSNRINAAFTFGGPALMARTVGNLVGVQPDYVFTTTFQGLKGMVKDIGGVTVNSRLAFTDDGMPGRIREGRNRLGGGAAVFFSRARHFLPRGDFDRSANQQELLRAILREVRAKQDRPGFMERGVFSVMEHLYTNLPPDELFQLAQAATAVDPSRFRGCVLGGRFGSVGGASIIFPNVSQARRLGNEARNDATFGKGC